MHHITQHLVATFARAQDFHHDQVHLVAVAIRERDLDMFHPQQHPVVIIEPDPDLVPTMQRPVVISDRPQDIHHALVYLVANLEQVLRTCHERQHQTTTHAWVEEGILAIQQRPTEIHDVQQTTEGLVRTVSLSLPFSQAIR